MKAQIEKFKMLTGSYPHRVDGHQHVHVLPIIRNVFAKVFVKRLWLPTWSPYIMYFLFICLPPKLLDLFLGIFR